MWKKPEVNKTEFELGGFNEADANEVAMIDGEGGGGAGLCLFFGYCCNNGGEFVGVALCVAYGGYVCR